MKTMILRLPLIALYPFLTMMASAQPPTDRESASLSGPVYSVTTCIKTNTEFEYRCKIGFTAEIFKIKPEYYGPSNALRTGAGIG